MVENKEMELHGCVVNFMWRPRVDTGCPLTMYIIYYREIQSGGNEDGLLQIRITQVKKTSYVIPLNCDTEYEIAMSSRDEKQESGISNSWRVKTKSNTIGMYFGIF